MSETNSRIHVLNNGRSPMKKAGDYITRAQAEQMVMVERAENERMVKWYMEQIPGLVAHVVSAMMADMCHANGLAFNGPGRGDAAAPEGAQ